MIYGFYFRFYRLLHREGFSCALSRLALGAYRTKYLCKKLLCRHRKEPLPTPEEALARIQAAYPDHPVTLTYTRSDLDPALDLSIIIPVYNHKDLLDKNIRSVLDQRTKYRFEVILVDDGSTDGAQDLIETHRSDPRIRIIHQRNQGIGGARNTGISMAQGRYLMFVDCDDEVSPDLVELLLSKAYAEDSKIAMCAHEVVIKSGDRILDVLPNVYPRRALYGYPPSARILDYPGFPWAKVFKRELFDRVRFFPGYWYEDTIIQWLLFSQCESLSYVPQVGYRYLWYENNFSHTQVGAGNVKSLDRYWLLKAILTQYAEMELPRGSLFHILLLRHVSVFYYPTFAGLKDDLVDALFVLARELVLQYLPEEPAEKLPYMLRETEKALRTGDIERWKLASRYQ